MHLIILQIILHIGVPHPRFPQIHQMHMPTLRDYAPIFGQSDSCIKLDLIPMRDLIQHSCHIVHNWAAPSQYYVRFRINNLRWHHFDIQFYRMLIISSHILSLIIDPYDVTFPIFHRFFLHFQLTSLWVGVVWAFFYEILPFYLYEVYLRIWLIFMPQINNAKH